jgi:hypothetical protein
MSTVTAAATASDVASGRTAARLNYWAVVVTAFAALVFSTVYYSLFADAWLALRGLSSTSGEVPTSPLLPLVELGRNLLLAYVFARLVLRLRIVDVKGALGLALVLWLTFPGMLWIGAIMWEGTPWQLAALHAGDWLFKCAAFAVLPSLWRR